MSTLKGKAFATFAVVVMVFFSVPVSAASDLSMECNSSFSDVKSSLESLLSEYDVIVMNMPIGSDNDVYISEFETLNDLKPGNLVIMDSNACSQKIGRYTHIYDPESNFSAIFKDRLGIIHCMSTSCEETDLSNQIIEWVGNVDEMMYENVPTATFTESTQSNIGKLTVTNLYYYLGTSNGYKYYAVEYRIQSTVLDGVSKNADHYIECQVDGENSFMNLLDAKPDNTYTMQSTTVGINFSIPDGVGVSVSWTFTTPICIINNQSDISDDLLDIWFDIQDGTSYTTEVTRPGCFVKVSTASQYESEEEIKAQFRTPYNHFWPWDPTYTWSTLSIVTHPILV